MRILLRVLPFVLLATVAPLPSHAGNPFKEIERTIKKNVPEPIKINRHDVIPEQAKVNRHDVVPDDLKINRHDLDVPDGLKINRHSVAGAVSTAWDQLHDGTVHLGHQTATNFRSVSEYIDARMASFCEAMGPDEDCVEDEVGAKVDNQGKVSTYNSSKGETYEVAMSGEYVATPSLPQFVIVQPGQSLCASPYLQDLSDESIAAPLPLWPLPYGSLPNEVQGDPVVAGRWVDFTQKYQLAKAAQTSGRVRGFVLVPVDGLGKVTAEDVVRVTYDVYNAGQLIKDVWQSLRGSYKASWLQRTATGAGIIFSPESIKKDDLVVLGLFPEEEAALKAARAYYDSLPTPLKIEYEKKPPVADSELKPAPPLPPRP